MTSFIHLDNSDRAAFERDGYVFKRGMFTPDEVALCNRVIATDPAIQGSRLKVADAAGGSTELALWNHPGDDVFGMFARCERVAGGAEQLLGGEVYHYHSKMIMKRPGGGGRWEWHQDYGYWYQNGCLWPDMLSVAVALDPATRENGCMQVLARQPQARPDRARPRRRPDRRRPGAGRAGAEAAGAGLLRDGAGRRPVLPRQHAALLGRQPLRPEPQPADLLLQQGQQRPVQGRTITRDTRRSPRSPDEAVVAAGDRVADAQGRWLLEEGKDETTEARKAG